MTIEQLMNKYDTRLAEAFRAGVVEITSRVVLRQFIEALERGDVAAALDALYIEEAAWREFEQAVSEAYGEGGDAAIEQLGQLRDQDGARFVFRFNARNLAAEQWLRENSSGLITRISEETRTIAREAIVEGLAQGNNPRQTALEIVGRVDKRTGRRTGGYIGLSKPFADAVKKSRQELSDGDYAAYLQREKRDRRFDSVVRKAIETETPLSADQIEGIVTRYSDRLLKLRGDTIARTETLASLNASQHEALRQLVESGKVAESAIRRVWKATRDGRTRDTHAVLEGESVGLNEPFVTFTGRRLMYPGDPQGGPSEVINCRCVVRPRIDYGANL